MTSRWPPPPPPPPPGHIVQRPGGLIPPSSRASHDSKRIQQNGNHHYTSVSPHSQQNNNGARAFPPPPGSPPPNTPGPYQSMAPPSETPMGGGPSFPPGPPANPPSGNHYVGPSNGSFQPPPPPPMRPSQQQMGGVPPPPHGGPPSNIPGPYPPGHPQSAPPTFQGYGPPDGSLHPPPPSYPTAASNLNVGRQPPPPPPGTYPGTYSAGSNTGYVAPPGPPPQRNPGYHPGGRPQPPPTHPQGRGVAPERPRIDPSHIPRPPLFTRPHDAPPPLYHPRAMLTTGDASDATMSTSLPPAADSRYLVRDDGNASPDVMRSTLYQFPQNNNVRRQTGNLPLGVLCTPLAVLSGDARPRPRVVLDDDQPASTTENGDDETQVDGAAARPHGTHIENWNDPQAVSLVFSAGSGLPGRCRHCLAYINPFFGLDGACNLCNGKNADLVPQLSGGSTPMQHGTVEYDVDGPYVTRDTPVQPVQLYALDLTCPHLLAYLPLLARLGQDMAEHAWRQHQGQQSWMSLEPDGSQKAAPKPRMGLCFVSSAGIVVHQRHGQDERRFAIMADVTEDPFCPLPLQDWTFDLSTPQGVEAWRRYIETELVEDMNALRQMARAKNAYGLDGLEASCGGAALAFMAQALQETGGRGAWLSWRRPNFGCGRLSHREEKAAVVGVTATTKNGYAVSTPLQAQTAATSALSQGDLEAAQFYQQLAQQCAKNRVALDIMMHTSSTSALGQPMGGSGFLDLATLGELCRSTCGKLMWVSTFNWEIVLYEELTRQLQSVSGWDAVFKVRCSDGIQVKSFLSNCGTVIDNNLGGSPELELTAVTPTTSIAVTLEHRVGGIPKNKEFVYLQSALLYTTTTGRRRVRVSTLALRISKVVNEVFRSIDFGATAAMLLRESVARLLACPNTEQERDELRSKSREALKEQCVGFLANYRLHTPAMNSPTGQLILPDKLQILPLFIMSVLKSPMFRQTVPRRIPGSQAVRLSPSSDERAFYMWHAAQVNASIAILLAHPRVFPVPLHNQGAVGQWHAGDGSGRRGFVRMPPPLVASMENLADDGVYLVDSGLAIFLVVGSLASEDIKESATKFLADMNPMASRLVWQMRAYCSTERGSESELRPTYPPVVAVVQQQGHQGSSEMAVLNLMIDDATVGDKDYSGFLVSLHQRVLKRVAANAY